MIMLVVSAAGARHCKSSRQALIRSGSCRSVKFAMVVSTLRTTLVCATRQVLTGIISACRLNRRFSFNTTAISHSVVSWT